MSLGNKDDEFVKAPSPSPPSAKKPNILVIWGDDWGTPVARPPPTKETPFRISLTPFTIPLHSSQNNSPEIYYEKIISFKPDRTSDCFFASW